MACVKFFVSKPRRVIIDVHGWADAAVHFLELGAEIVVVATRYPFVAHDYAINDKRWRVTIPHTNCGVIAPAAVVRRVYSNRHA